MKRFIGVLTALCSLVVFSTAHANYYQKYMRGYSVKPQQNVTSHRVKKKVKRHVMSPAMEVIAYEKKFSSSRPATGNSVFIFDPSKTAWAAYDGSGKLVKAGAASGGKNYCADVGRRCLTPRGKFRVYRKGSVACKSSKYPLGRGGARMPYCMFFRGGYAIHGSSHVPRYNASHGCIRVKPHMASWLSKNFIRHGTTVIVKPY